MALLATLWALVPSIKVFSLDQDRRAFILKGDSVGLRRWDSIHGKNYREDQKNFLAHPIKRGLDLQGGIYITMEVDIPTMLFESAVHDAIDSPFVKAIDATRAESANSDEPVIDIFHRNFWKYVSPTGKGLGSYYDLGTSDTTELNKKLARNVDDAVDQAMEVIRQRVDKYGVSEASIQKTGRRIVVELPGVTDQENINSLLSTTARLEFKLVKNDADAIKLLRRIDEVLAGKVNMDSTGVKKDTVKTHDSTTAKADSTKKDSTKTAKKDSTKTKKDSALAKIDSTKVDSTKKPDTSKKGSDSTPKMTEAEYLKAHPFTIFLIRGTGLKVNEDAEVQDAGVVFQMKESEVPKGEYFLSTSKDAVDRMKALLARPEVKAILPDDRIIAFSAHAESGDPVKGPFGIYILEKDPQLTGEVISDATANFDPQTGKPSVSMSMTRDGADKWADITGRNIKKRIAIVLDSSVYSAPTVQGKIPGGSSAISGSSDIKEASLLAVVLKSGALKAPVKIIQGQLVGPSLGEDSITQGMTATGLAAVLVVLFMLFYYAFGGAIADLAVMFNVMITLAALAAFNATLTLPGIGGLVLTIGMAVDGNILIYERIREELASGKSLLNAVKIGYDKAFAAIIDTHITTFMTGAILYYFGTGPIKGFAITLMIGIAATLFTAVFVTKTVFLLMLDRGTTSINFGQPKDEAAAA
ncbi:MAG: protein translocase subunit SecD [Candidatus Kapaibacterium sp.]